MVNHVTLSAGRPTPAVTAFERRELDQVLRVYGRMVAAGEWRDYALNHEKDRAAFSVFRRAHEAPLFVIEKRPALAKRQGAYQIIGQGGVILKRGADLAQVLRYFDKKLFKIVGGRRD